MPPNELAGLARRGLAGMDGPRPRLRLGPEASAALAFGRAHEVGGPARLVFAAMVAGALERAGDRGPVLWVRLAHAEGRLNPDGLAAFFDPSRMVIATPRRREDVLWTLEEALRSGACRLAVAELAPGAPAPALTPVRRLHLAAEAGSEAAAARDAGPPLGLLLTSDAGGAAGVETRWRMSFAPSTGGAGPCPHAPRWRLDLQRARMAPPRSWIAAWAEDGLRLRPVGPEPAPPAPPRAQPARARGASSSQ